MSNVLFFSSLRKPDHDIDNGHFGSYGCKYVHWVQRNSMVRLDLLRCLFGHRHRLGFHCKYIEVSCSVSLSDIDRRLSIQHIYPKLGKSRSMETTFSFSARPISGYVCL